MSKQLEVNHLHKFVEEDVYNEGCLPQTAQSTVIDQLFRCANQAELIAAICAFLGIDNNPENYEVNACGEDGRIDFAVMENEAGYTANSTELKQWENGKCRLWSANYSAYVEIVSRKRLKLEKINE